MATDSLSITLGALADPTRRAILARLAEGAATVKELSAPFAMSGPAISKHLRQWWLTPPGWTLLTCEMDLRPGGASRIQWRNAEGAEMELRGVNQEIVPPERLVGTSSFSTSSWGALPETLNTVTFTEEDG